MEPGLQRLSLRQRETTWEYLTAKTFDFLHSAGKMGDIVAFYVAKKVVKGELNIGTHLLEIGNKQDPATGFPLYLRGTFSDSIPLKEDTEEEPESPDDLVYQKNLQNHVGRLYMARITAHDAHLLCDVSARSRKALQERFRELAQETAQFTEPEKMELAMISVFSGQ